MGEMKKSWFVFSFLLISLVGLLMLPMACGGAENSIGFECNDHADCPGEARCLRGNRFPGGTCTIACDGHFDCPGFASCIDREGGVCLENCDRGRDCRGGYECNDEENFGSGGDTNVCIGE